jgi:hypothetical protein
MWRWALVLMPLAAAIGLSGQTGSIANALPCDGDPGFRVAPPAWRGDPGFTVPALAWDIDPGFSPRRPVPGPQRCHDRDIIVVTTVPPRASPVAPPPRAMPRGTPGP